MKLVALLGVFAQAIPAPVVTLPLNPCTTMRPFVIAPAAFQSSAVQKPNSVVGTWRLVSASASSAGGATIDYPFGPSPKGLLTYTADGRMTVIISHGGRKPLSGDRISAAAEERAEAFATFFAYAGRYSLDGDRVVHHVEERLE